MPLPDPTPELEDTNPDDEFYAVRPMFYNYHYYVLKDDDDVLSLIVAAMRAINA